MDVNNSGIGNLYSQFHDSLANAGQEFLPEQFHDAFVSAFEMADKDKKNDESKGGVSNEDFARYFFAAYSGLDVDQINDQEAINDLAELLCDYGISTSENDIDENYLSEDELNAAMNELKGLEAPEVEPAETTYFDALEQVEYEADAALQEAASADNGKTEAGEEVSEAAPVEEPAAEPRQVILKYADETRQHGSDLFHNANSYLTKFPDSIDYRNASDAAVIALLFPDEEISTELGADNREVFEKLGITYNADGSLCFDGIEDYLKTVAQDNSKKLSSCVSGKKISSESSAREILDAFANLALYGHGNEYIVDIRPMEKPEAPSAEEGQDAPANEEPTDRSPETGQESEEVAGVPAAPVESKSQEAEPKKDTGVRVRVETNAIIGIDFSQITTSEQMYQLTQERPELVSQIFGSYPLNSVQTAAAEAYFKNMLSQDSYSTLLLANLLISDDQTKGNIINYCKDNPISQNDALKLIQFVMPSKADQKQKGQIYSMFNLEQSTGIEFETLNRYYEYVNGNTSRLDLSDIEGDQLAFLFCNLPINESSKPINFDRNDKKAVGNIIQRMVDAFKRGTITEEQLQIAVDNLSKADGGELNNYYVETMQKYSKS